MITEIVTAAEGGDYNLTTSAYALAAMGLSSGDIDATRLTDMIAVASAMAESYCGRIFAYERIKETYAGTGDRLLYLRRYPVRTLHAITIDGVAVSSGDYELHDDERGIIAHKYGVWSSTSAAAGVLDTLPVGSPRKLIEVETTAGYELPGWSSPTAALRLPFDLEEAIAQIIGVINQGATQSSGVTAEKIGDYAVTYATSAEETVPAMARVRLARYRRLSP